jgi:hypothetical protein
LSLLRDTATTVNVRIDAGDFNRLESLAFRLW